MKLIELWTLAVFKRDNGWCQKCMSEGRWVRAVDAHHGIHKTGGRYLRYLMDNGVSLCRPCHLLDDQGKLKPWFIEFVGQDKYDEMKLTGNLSVAAKIFDEDAVRQDLKAYLAPSVSDPGVSS